MEEIASPAEEQRPLAADPVAPSDARKPVRAYDPAVLHDRQPRITDLIPVRPLAVAAALLSCVAGLTLVVGVHAVSQGARGGAHAQVLAPLDLAQPASIARWLGAMWLVAAAGLAMLIYRIRVHRADDYQGRYRVWLWAAAAWAWLSLDTVATLHTPLGWLLAQMLGRGPSPTATAATLAWMGLYGAVFGALGLRLALELRCSPASVAMLGLVAGLYLASAAFGLGWLASGDARRDALLAPLAPLMAHGLSLWMALWYARHVYLDAAGRLRVHIEAGPRTAYAQKCVRWWRGIGRPQAGSADTADAAAAKNAAAARDAAAPSSPAPPAADTPARFGPAGTPPAAGARNSREPLTVDDSIADDPQTGEAHLSRAERRRAKRLARANEQRRAA